MKTAHGAWRATYTHGRWVVLSGPTCMVIMQPAPAAATSLINSIWDKLVDSASISEISHDLTGFGLDSMPDLAVFFWDAEQLHCLLRGALRVLDADSGEVLASGTGARTWYETTLTTARAYVPLDDVDPTQLLQLPLVVGAVQASAVYLDATDAAPAVAEPPAYESAEPALTEEAAPAALGGLSDAGNQPEVALGEVPQPVPVPAVVPLPPSGMPPAPPVPQPEPELEPEPESVPDPLWEPERPAPEPAPEPESEGEPDEDPVPNPLWEPQTVPEPLWQPEAPEPEMAQQSEPGPVWQPEPDQLVTPYPSEVPEGAGVVAPEPTEVLSDRPPFAPGQEPQVREAADFGPRFGSGPSGTTGPWGPQGFAAGAVSPTPAGAPAPLPADDAQVVVPPPPQEVRPTMPARKVPRSSDNDGETVFTTGIAATHKPSGGRRADSNLVLAATCPLGHANAPGAVSCRICGGRVDSHNPQLVNRPVLAVLATSAGDELPLTGPIVIGRAPTSSGSDPDAQLLRVPSPNYDISRNHVRVAPEDWNISVTDLHSTNGTTLRPPGGQPIRLEPGQTMELPVGGVIELGDGQVVTLRPAH